MGTTFSRIMKSDPYHEPAGSSKGGRFASKQTNGAEDPTETKEFKDWFGSSVVTDDKGKPKIVYHGDSGNATFKDKDFYTPAWFTDERELAAGYGKVTAYYLRLTNPKKYDDVDDMGDSTADNDGEIADDISGTVYMVKDASSIRSVPKRKSIAKLEIIRTLKIDPYHDKIGRFSSAPVSAEGWDAVQKNPVLKAGTKFIAYRVGTSPELKGVNGGNAFGIEAHILNWQEEGEIKDEKIYAHEVTLTKDTGEYEHIGFKGNPEEKGTNPQVGRDQYFFGTGYSFPSDGAGFTSKLIKEVPVKGILAEAAKDEDNTHRIATAIDKAFSNKKPLWDEKGNFSESLGIDCGDMPQIQSSDFAEFTEFAKTKGVTITPEQVPVSSLKPTQKHFNVEQAKQLTPEALNKPITVSKNNYVLDGTNRWARNLELNPDGKVNINRMSIPVRKALELMFSFPKVFSKTLAQVGATQKGDKDGHEFHGNQWTDHTGQTETPEFKAWFKGSTAVGQDGKPARFFHVSTFAGKDGKGIATFKPSIGGLLGSGVYLTSDLNSNPWQGRPKAYAIPLYVSLKNPAFNEDLEKYEYVDGGETEVEFAKRLGHDGIVMADRGTPAENWFNFTVFDPKQLKSAIGNNGKFDPKNPNITKMDFVKILKAA